jgi:hypothetical protein
VTRYYGEAKQRILTGKGSTDWIHGHWFNKVGIGRDPNAKWMTTKTNLFTGGKMKDWLIFCGQNKSSTTNPNSNRVFKYWNWTKGHAISNAVPNSEIAFSGHTIGINLWTQSTGDSDWALRDVIVWNQALSSIEIDKVISSLAKKIGEQVLPSAVSHYKYSDFEVTTGGGKWKDSLDPNNDSKAPHNITGTFIKNTKEISGDKNTKIKFSALPSPAYTICSVTRYNGAAKGRILTGSSTDGKNWLHGHVIARAGIAHYLVSSTWMTPFDNSRLNDNTDWLIFCGQNKSSYTANPDTKRVFMYWDWIQGQAISVAIANTTASAGGFVFGINIWAGEHSDWALRDVIIWDKGLSSGDISYIMNKLAEELLSEGCDESGHC